MYCIHNFAMITMNYKAFNTVVYFYVVNMSSIYTDTQ